MLGHKDLKTAINQTIKKVVSMGFESPAGIWQGVDSFKDMNMKVIINENFSVPIPLHKDLMEHTAADEEWVNMHFAERVSGIPSNPGSSFRIWPYANFKNKGDAFKNTEDEKFSHTYMERFWPKHANDKFQSGIRFNYGDLHDVITQLNDNPLSRQAYLPIFFPEDTGATEGQRVPCTLGYHFFIWDNRLHINYYIRSCDIYRHFRNDMYFTAMLAHWVLLKLEVPGLKMGTMNIMIANLHVFVNDIYNLEKREDAIQKLQNNNRP